MIDNHSPSKEYLDLLYYSSEIIAKNLKAKINYKDLRILDFGAGTGDVSIKLQYSGAAKVMAYEPSPGFYDYIKSTHYNLDVLNQLNSINIFDYDIVFCNSVIQYIKQEELNEIFNFIFKNENITVILSDVIDNKNKYCDAILTILRAFRDLNVRLLVALVRFYAKIILSGNENLHYHTKEFFIDFCKKNNLKIILSKNIGLSPWRYTCIISKGEVNAQGN